MKLSRQSVWSLDDKVSKYGKRPWFQRLPNADALTIRLLLQHRGGLENYYNNPRFFEWYRARLAEDPSYVPGFDTLIEFVCDRPPLFAPGQGFNYTDVGYLHRRPGHGVGNWSALLRSGARIALAFISFIHKLDMIYFLCMIQKTQ